MIACGLPHLGRGDAAPVFRREFAVVQEKVAGLRRFGAASLDLAWVAGDNSISGCWERDLSPWDMAAGLLMVREAGGFVSDCGGGDAIMTKRQIVAGNEIMHKALLTLLGEAARG